MPDAPAVTVVKYPVSNVYQQDPIVFRWLPVASADEYELEIDGATTTLPAGSCVASVCESPQNSIETGPLDWRVRAVNSGGDGPWSPSVGIEVLLCSPPNEVIELDADDIGSGSLFETCNKIIAGNGYKVQTGEDVTFHTADEIELHNGFSIENGGALTIQNDY